MNIIMSNNIPCFTSEKKKEKGKEKRKKRKKSVTRFYPCSEVKQIYKLRYKLVQLNLRKRSCN